MSAMESIATYPSQADVDPSFNVPFVPKNSISHPINISWMIPLESISLLAKSGLPDKVDLYDIAFSQTTRHLLALQQAQQPICTPKLFGNLALSSCPGKKVRLSGPVRGRAAINRDLDLDFARLNRQFGITTIVCCLDDAELSFLGAPWPRYYELAMKHNIEILRLPMLEGSCPHTIEEIDVVVDLATEKMRNGENVLTHCRGGVGRAGLFACCLLLKNRFCLSAERAIRYVRLRRSPKSIETMRQAEFIIHYARYIHKLHEHRQRESELVSGDNLNPLHGSAILTPYMPLPSHGPPPLIHTDISLAVPSNSEIASLESQVTNSLPGYQNFANSQPPPPTIIARAHTSPAILVAGSHALGLYGMETAEEVLQPVFM